MLTELSLFSGIGGGLLGSELLGWRAVGYVEWDRYCCSVLEQRIRDGLLEDAPVFEGDVREFIAQGYAGAYTGMVDIVTGGPPCQGFSEAGKKLGEQDPRNMVPAMLDIVEIVRPAFVLIENAPTRAYRNYLRDYALPRLAAMGFDAAWGVISAEDAIWAECYPGVPAIYHERKRTWLLAASVANAEKLGCNSRIYRTKSEQSPRDGSELVLPEDADAHGYRCTRTPILSRSRRSGQAETDTTGDAEAERIGGWWTSERELVRLVHGLPNRVDRVRAAGNAQVPAVVRLAFECLSGECR